jgi:hypothetical protein
MQAIQNAKDEVLATRKEIIDFSKTLFTFFVTTIENSRRWDGWTDKRYEKEMNKIRKMCAQYNIPETEVFYTQTFWKKIDQLMLVKNILSINLEDQLKEDLEKEWDLIVTEKVPMDRILMFVDYASLSDIERKKLKEDIKQIIQ